MQSQKLSFDLELEGLKGKKVLLIGGAGFIGHNLALSLKKNDVDVSIVDGLQVNNLLSFHHINNTLLGKSLYLKIIDERLSLLRDNDIPLYVEDARDYGRLSKLINSLQPEVIVLLAAVSHASRSNKDPLNTFDHSFRTLENALDCSRHHNVKHFIYFSSSMVYGNFESDSVNEESPCNPLGIYGALKYGAEKLVIAYNQVFGLNYTIIRPSALYGERCVSRRVGQIFIENALRGSNLSIMGDGIEKLDFTYIGDLVQGVCRIISNPSSFNQIFNLTYGEGRSILDMAHLVRDHFSSIDIKNVKRDALVPERGTLDVTKAKTLIGYVPENPLEIGYIKYINWYKSLAYSSPELFESNINSFNDSQLNE